MDEPASPSTSTDDEYTEAPTRGSQTYTASPTKRRLPNQTSAPGNNRDVKSRKRESRAEDKKKEQQSDLVDLQLSEHFRKVYGDPFNETSIKTEA